MSVTAPEQTAPAVQDQQPAAPAAPAPVAPTPSSPWEADLAASFPDPAVRAQVDMYYRTKTQPYITQLEQANAQSRDAMSLWTDLQNNPGETFAAITTELFGDEAGGKALETLNAALSTPDTTVEEAVQAAGELDPRLAKVIEIVENQQNEQQYNTLMTQTIAGNPDLSPDLLHPFVAASGGDFNRAVAMYRDMAQRMGVQPQAAPAAPAAPPVMSSSDGIAAPSNAPLQPAKQTLDEAINDFMREQHREAPPVL